MEETLVPSDWNSLRLSGIEKDIRRLFNIIGDNYMLVEKIKDLEVKLLKKEMELKQARKIKRRVQRLACGLRHPNKNKE